MTLIEVLIIAIGLIVAGIVVLFAIVFVTLGAKQEQIDMLLDLYRDQGEAYDNLKTTLDILLREHAALTRQVRSIDRVVDGLVDVDQTTVIYRGVQP